jgi:hypothetical protein
MAVTRASELVAADEFRRAQAMVAATLSRDLVRLMRGMFNTVDPGASWPGLRMAVAALILDRRRQSADLAARYYRISRQLAGVDRAITPRPPINLVEDRLTANINATGIGVYKQALRAGATPEKALDRSAVTLSGAASKLALEGGRSVVDQTVRHDERAIGWARVGDGNPCSWCAMLISRGAVYRSAKTAGQGKNSRFVGEGNFKFHDHDGCVAVPVWSEDDPVLDRADELYDQWLQATQGHSGHAAINVWRQHWESRDAGEQASDG